MSERKPTCWTTDRDAERITATTIAEAVGEWADYVADAMPLRELPETIEVYGYAPMELPPPIEASRWVDPLGRLLEWLDEEYGDPEGVPTLPTDAIRDAELAFLRTVLAEYKAWMCERVCTRTVRVRDYIDAEGYVLPATERSGEGES